MTPIRLVIKLMRQFDKNHPKKAKKLMAPEWFIDALDEEARPYLIDKGYAESRITMIVGLVIHETQTAAVWVE